MIKFCLLAVHVSTETLSNDPGLFGPVNPQHNLNPELAPKIQSHHTPPASHLQNGEPGQFCFDKRASPCALVLSEAKILDLGGT